MDNKILPKEIILIAGKNIDNLIKDKQENLKDKDVPTKVDENTSSIPEELYNFIELNEGIIIHLKSIIHYNQSFVESDGGKVGAKTKKLNTIEIVARILGGLIEEDNIGIIHIENGTFKFSEYNDKKIDDFVEELKDKKGKLYLGYKNIKEKLLVGQSEYKPTMEKLHDWFASYKNKDENKTYKDVFIDLIYPDGSRKKKSLKICI